MKQRYISFHAMLLCVKNWEFCSDWRDYPNFPLRLAAVVPATMELGCLCGCLCHSHLMLWGSWLLQTRGKRSCHVRCRQMWQGASPRVMPASRRGRNQETAQRSLGGLSMWLSANFTTIVSLALPVHAAVTQQLRFWLCYIMILIKIKPTTSSWKTTEN